MDGYHKDHTGHSLFALKVIRPPQFFTSLDRGAIRREKLLMLAVLEDAINCFQLNLFADYE